MKDLLLHNGIVNYQFIGESDVIFDVGLNVGDKTACFLNLGCRVVGFEPQKDIYLQARKRFEGRHGFMAENIALDDKKGVAVMYIAGYHTLSSMNPEFISQVKEERFSGYSWDKKEIVNTDTLDNMILRYGIPKYIKIDVEGYELSVLKGLTRKINYISIEFIPEMIVSVKECIDYVDTLNQNSTRFNYLYRENDHFYFDEWVSKSQIMDYLNSVDDRKYEFGDIFLRADYPS